MVFNYFEFGYNSVEFNKLNSTELILTTCVLSKYYI